MYEYEEEQYKYEVAYENYTYFIEKWISKKGEGNYYNQIESLKNIQKIIDIKLIEKTKTIFGITVFTKELFKINNKKQIPVFIEKFKDNLFYSKKDIINLLKLVITFNDRKAKMYFDIIKNFIDYEQLTIEEKAEIVLSHDYRRPKSYKNFPINTEEVEEYLIKNSSFVNKLIEKEPVKTDLLNKIMNVKLKGNLEDFLNKQNNQFKNKKFNFVKNG